MSDQPAEQVDQPAEEADQGDIARPWTIKNIPPEARNAAIEAARRDKQPLGEWIARAIRAKIQTDRQVDRAPVALDQPGGGAVKQVDREADLSALERMIALADKIAATPSLPPDIASKSHTMIRAQMKAIKGG